MREASETESYPFSEKCFLAPMSDLRLRINEWKPEQSIMFICEKGPRAYEAARIFVNHGYKDVCYLGGGTLLYSMIRNCRAENLALNSEEVK